MLVGDLCALVLGEALVHRPVDRLAHMAGQALPTLAAGGGQLLDSFLLQALAQFGLASSFLSVALVSISQLAVKGAIMPPVAGGQEIDNAHVHAHHRGTRFCVDCNHLIVAEGQPPAIIALVEDHAAIDGLVLECLAVIVGQLNRNQQLFAECEGADREPVIKGRVLRRFELDHISIGLDADLPEYWDVPFFPGRFFPLHVERAFGLLLVKGQQIIHVVLVGLGAIGAPGPRDACRLLDGDAMPALGEGSGKQRGA